MGCFSTCFGNKRRCRHIRRRAAKTNHPSSLLHHLQTYESVEGFEVPKLIQEEIQEEIEKGENQIEVTPLVSNDEKKEKEHSSGKKKVTFDLNVKVYEDLRTYEQEEEEGEENDDFVENNDEGEAEIKEDKYAKVSVGTQCNSDSSNSSLFSFPTNHRYQNCCNSDDDFDEILSSDESESDYYTDDDDDDDDDDDGEVDSGIKSEKQEKVQDQSSESLFSLSLDSRKHGFDVERGEKEVNSPLPIKNSSTDESNSNEMDRKYVESVLNPVENLSQWKFIKAKSKLASKDQQAKENMNLGQSFTFPVKKEVVDKEIGVDTSLSTWLGGSSKKDNSNNNSKSSSVSVGNAPSDRKNCSPNKFEDRPILGALTLEEIRLISATSSPRKSPSKSPEDVPIIGSVGSYWSHTAQTADSETSTKSTKSRYRESAEVIWDATPFETRLEKALEKESNGEQILAM